MEVSQKSDLISMEQYQLNEDVENIKQQQRMEYEKTKDKQQDLGHKRANRNTIRRSVISRRTSDRSGYRFCN